MLILQKDYITIDLEKTGTRTCWPKENGDIYSLIITVQCNGKMKRHNTSFQTHFEDLNTPDGLVGWKELQINHWEGIHATIELLDSLWYELDVLEVQSSIEQMLRNITD